jgi:hypothetical protein
MSSPIQISTGDQNHFWPRELALGLLPLLIGIEVLISIVFVPSALRGGADFRQLYAGGYMIRTGQRKALYDYPTEAIFESRLTGLGESLALPINHLPYEELLFVPLSALTYRTAFILFLLMNLLILGVAIHLVLPEIEVLYSRWKPFPILIFFAFPPIVRTLIQGQDSIILLTLLSASLVSLRTRKEFTAGLITGLGLFKFQLILPVGVLFLLWRRWRFVSGFCASSLFALGV